MAGKTGSNEQEIWKKVPGAAMHEVSSLGRVRSTARGKAMMIRAVPLSKEGNRYLRIMAGGRSWLVHRLVAILFCPHPNPCKWDVVIHVNKDYNDNRACNLKWMHRSDTYCGLAAKAVSAWMGEDMVGMFASEKEAYAKTGCPEKSICAAVKGKLKGSFGRKGKYAGHKIKWRYAE